ncbi:hypothetical protein [Haladaptatus sp. NG-SE-30]
MTNKLVGERHERSELAVIPPAIPREEFGDGGIEVRRAEDEGVEDGRVGNGRVGAVAYPYRIFEVVVTMTRPFLSNRTDRFVASVDRSRRLAVRADAFPDVETRAIEDVLVLPEELSGEQSRAKARESVFQWTLRRYSLNDAPDIEFVREIDAYKLFWIVERPEGDVIVDSLRGDEDPLHD